LQNHQEISLVYILEISIYTELIIKRTGCDNQLMPLRPYPHEFQLILLTKTISHQALPLSLRKLISGLVTHSFITVPNSLSDIRNDPFERFRILSPALSVEYCTGTLDDRSSTSTRGVLGG